MGLGVWSAIGTPRSRSSTACWARSICLIAVWISPVAGCIIVGAINGGMLVVVLVPR
jgi:hypothetical protein